VKLATFAELAVRLVNSAAQDGAADPLRSREAFRELVADRPFLAVPVQQSDLDRLKLLRTDLARIFRSASAGDGADVAARLNALLVTHPLHPVIVSHDGDERWHLHLSEAGSASDRFAAGAVSGLAMIVTQVGLHKIGVCSIASCDRVFIDGSSNKSRRYCGVHSAARATVATLDRLQDEGTEFATDPVKSAAS
jgi:predicted RNA-binding Zn ribbon-like protein